MSAKRRIVGTPIRACIGAFHGVEGLNKINQRLTRHHLVYLGQKLLAFGQLFGSALLMITKFKLFTIWLWHPMMLFIRHLFILMLTAPATGPMLGMAFAYGYSRKLRSSISSRHAI